MKLKQFLINHRENLQLLYGIFLIILIPSLIAFNTIFIINKYNSSMDATLQRKALVVGRSIYASLQDDLDNEEKIQEKIQKISERNSEFENIEVLIPEKNSFKIIASSDQDEIGNVLDFYYYQTAWTQPDNNGLATDSLTLATDIEGQSLADESDKDDRFWLVAMPMQDNDGNKQAILSIKISSKVIDDLTDYNKNASLAILLITVIITILFLSITVRLWDYVVLYKKIKDVDQIKDEFISIASHELRTPLTSIKGYTSLIMEGTFGKIKNAKINESLNRIMLSSGRLEALVEDLLDVSRLEQGRLSFEKKNIQIEPIIKEIVSQLSVTAERKKLKLTYKKSAKKLPKIAADPDRVKQVLVNLIGNAVKYTEKGSVIVTNEVKGKKLYIKVSDTGIGISPEGQRSLFQKFYRVKTEKTETIQGTGLGLWITKKITELMNGRIYLESIEGRGTQVTVILPLATEEKK
ncbi:MAG: HAMP domain-containing sensor histidine kinase [Candidatus Paceibacterota bacterium]